MNNALGLYIPNSDYSFECSLVKSINEYIFVVTKTNEVITYKNEEDPVKGINLKKKFILLTHPQSREEIYDIFIMNKSQTLLDLSNFVIVTITKNLIFHFWDIKDGLCINKLNLSNYKSREDTLIKTFSLNERSILVLLNLNGLVIVEEENLGFDIKKIYRVKENKFFLLSATDETYFLEIKNINPYSEKNDMQDICTEVSYRLYKHTFNINKVFKEDTLHCLISNKDFIFYNFNQQLGVSFLDSVEELSELASLQTDHKSKIYFLGKIERSEEELLILIYKDLWCETFSYDKIHREIKRKEKFAIMIEDEYFNLKFTTLDQYLVGYIDSQILIFDIRKFISKGEKYVDRTIELKNIYGRNKKDIFFTNYFKDNFESYHKLLKASLQTSNVKLVRDYLKEKEEDKLPNDNITQDIKITASAYLCHHQNESIYYIIGTSNGKVAIIDIFFDENLNLSPIIIMDYHTTAITSLQIYEHRLLIAASVDGIITFTDISKEQLSKVVKRKDSKIKNSDKIFEKNEVYRDEFGLSKTSSKSFEVSSNLNYYYSKKKSLIGKDISNMMVFDEESNDESNKSIEENFSVMNLLPIQTYKNYNKLKRIIFITQLDNLSLNLDENFKPIQKKILGFELENNSVLVIDMKTLKIIYSYNIYTEKNDITAIYHIESEKCLIFYQDNNIIKIVNYVTKTADRIVTDLTKIYAILRVEEKLKMYFIDGGGKFITNDFNVKYHRAKEDKKESESKREISSRLLNNSIGPIISNSSHISDKFSKHSDMNSVSDYNLSIEYITQILKKPNEKKIFIQKYLHNVYNMRKIHMNITYSKFESVWLNKLESYIIDELFSIVNSSWMSDLIKKIKIMNLIYNPLIHYKLYNRFEYETQGIEENTIRIGNQLNEYLSLNFEDFCLYVEKIVNKRNEFNQNNGRKRRNNFYNFISLFRIWNLSIDQDLNIYNFLRIYQPIFEFNIILRGYDCALSLLLNEEPEIRENLSGHFNFFNSYLNANEDTKKIMKEERFCNKKYIINRQQGFLVNFKNYMVSSNLSHLMNLTFFSILTAALGFQESLDISRVMTSEKLLIRSLSQLNFISFTNMSVINKFMYDYIDSVTISNKDIILVDYLVQKYSTINDPKTKDVTENHFINSINMIRTYLNMVYAYLFDMENLDEIFVNFNKFQKEKNLENQKLGLISEFELSLVNILIMYNSIAEVKDRLDDISMTKITHLLILFAFKILNPSFSHFYKPNYSKTVVELLSKSTDIVDKIYKDNSSSYAKLLIDFYSSIKIPIDLEGLFKKYEIGNCVIIKAENNLNFLKIMVAKLIKNYSKININNILKIIIDEFKKKTQEYDYFSYLLEILWIIFREKNSKHVNFLPPLINLIITAMSPLNKEMKTLCLENAKKVLSCLLPNYPMISFHQNRQRLSVGANDGKIYIYDLASCNMWKNLNAHTNEITALTFDFSGNILISYSSSEATIGLTNFFSNFFSMKDGYYKAEKFKVIESEIKNEDKINVVKFQLMPKNDNKVVLIREDKSVEVLNL